jgi:NADP-dependent 3-hydroxy acid dehydrogenase YdfG
MSQRVVVITGASSGIGAELAVALAGRGDQVVLAARRQDALDDVAARCHGRALTVVTDVTRRADVKRLVQAAVETHRRIDVWVNNAGQGISRVPSELTSEDIDLMIDTNVKSALYGMQEVLPVFKAQGSGHLINVSSMLGRIPYAVIRSAYCGAKHFLNALTATFREEVQATHPGIHVSLVSPGVVYTEFGKNAVHGGPDSRQLPDGQPAEDVAAVIASVIDSREPDVYTRAGLAARVVDYFASVGKDPK